MYEGKVTLINMSDKSHRMKESMAYQQTLFCAPYYFLFIEFRLILTRFVFIAFQILKLFVSKFNCT